ARRTMRPTGPRRLGRTGRGQEARHAQGFGGDWLLRGLADRLFADFRLAAGGVRPGRRGRRAAGYPPVPDPAGVVRGPDPGVDDALGAGGRRAVCAGRGESAPEWAGDAQARLRLARWAMEALYRNAGAEPPGPDIDPQQRFSFQGQGPQGPVRVEAQIRVTADEWLEAVVIAGPD